MSKPPLPISFTPKYSLLKFVRQSTFLEDTRLNKAVYRCVCGNEKEALINNAKMGKTKSCGCRRFGGARKHGLSTHPLYGVWENMYARCYIESASAYKNYGGRGVRVCDEWLKPETFIKWGLENGWQPGLELDKDTKGNGLLYSPESCCFLTSIDNSNCRRTSKYITFNGKTQTQAQWAREIGMHQSSLHIRIKKWSIDRALTEPLGHIKKGRP